MPIKTDLNVTPYFDDFDEDKKFHRVLFRPSVPVQARELTQLQTILQNQVERFGDHVFKESNRLNSTWGGNLVDMDRCTAYLEIIESEDLVSKARENGNYLSSGLSTLNQNYPDLVSNVRNKGLFAAFDLPSMDIRNKTIQNIATEGALMLGCGNNSIRFRPHLNISKP